MGVAGRVSFTIGDVVANNTRSVRIDLLTATRAPVGNVALTSIYLSPDPLGAVPTSDADAGYAVTDAGAGRFTTDPPVPATVPRPIVTDATGRIDLSLERLNDSESVYINVSLPNGKVVTSQQITFPPA